MELSNKEECNSPAPSSVDKCWLCKFFQDVVDVLIELEFKEQEEKRHEQELE